MGDSETSDRDFEVLGREFRRLRDFHNEPREIVAKRLNMSVGTVANFENAAHAPTSENFVRFSEQIDSWRKALDKCREPIESYGREKILIRDFECPECGESTPGPTEVNQCAPLWCAFCGGELGVECLRCGTIETRKDAKFCRACGGPLTDEAVAEKAAAEESKEMERLRKIREDARKQRERRARGEPEM